MYEINPFRYRGYYYDVETGWYYLQSRYYNPTWGRFLNADAVELLGANADLISYNLYVYCSNNPIMYVDPTGEFFLAFFTVIEIVVAVLAVAATVNDIYQLASKNVIAETTSSTDEGDPTDNVHIKDSAKILTPWVQIGYSFYLNHINEETKDVIDGTTMGIAYEWALHNVAYIGSSIFGLENYADSARSVDVGKTLFSDNHNNLVEHGMKSLYMASFPLCSIIDIIINGGYN